MGYLSNVIVIVKHVSFSDSVGCRLYIDSKCFFPFINNLIAFLQFFHCLGHFPSFYLNWQTFKKRKQFSNRIKLKHNATIKRIHNQLFLLASNLICNCVVCSPTFRRYMLVVSLMCLLFGVKNHYRSGWVSNGRRSECGNMLISWN